MTIWMNCSIKGASNLYWKNCAASLLGSRAIEFRSIT